MCGRTSLFIPRDELEERFEASIASDIQYTPRFNIAPGSQIEVITNSEQGTIQQYRWGFQPKWAEGPRQRLINARSESVESKNTFKESWQKRPCLVLSSGFYEWKETPKGPNQPYRIHKEGSDAFAMAGLWRKERNNGQENTVTILTTAPNDLMASIHDRMPVILAEEEEREWLQAGREERSRLCRPYQGGDLAAYPISTSVNDPNNDTATIIDEIEKNQSDLTDFY